MLVNIGTCQVNPSYVESVSNPYQSLGCMNHQLYFEVRMQSGATYEVLDEASKVHDYFDELMYYCNNRAARDKGDYSKQSKEWVQEKCGTNTPPPFAPRYPSKGNIRKKKTRTDAYLVDLIKDEDDREMMN